MVECNLAKVDVEGSNPFSRSAKENALRFAVRGRFLLLSGFGGGVLNSLDVRRGCAARWRACGVASGDSRIPPTGPRLRTE